MSMTNVESLRKYLGELSWGSMPRGAHAELADRCGVSHASVHKWSQGQTAPQPQYWPAIEDAHKLARGTLAKVAQVDHLEFTTAKRRDMLNRLASAQREAARIVEILAELEHELKTVG
jgi:DNA-binding transcriptional regulator YdaS (Cro superfamily)